MIKVSDLIFKHLVEKHNIHHCFLVTSGGAMHLEKMAPFVSEELQDECVYKPP